MTCNDHLQEENPMTPTVRVIGRTAGYAAMLALCAGLAPSGPAAAAEPPRRDGVVERFMADPLSGRGRNPFFAEGAAGGRFAYVGSERPHFPGDRRGTLRVLYDTTLPTARIATPLARVLSVDEDFAFGAILTIRSHGFDADPDGFAQIAFGLWNAHSTGSGRASFPADTFDLVEFDYFPNLTSFGGPFLSPSVFGGAVSGNAFDNLVFVSKETALPLDVPLLCHFSYDAAARRLTLTVNRHDAGVRFTPIDGAEVAVDLTTLSPGFLVDVLGIAAYSDGTPALRAEVDFDLLYFGAVPAPFRADAARRVMKRAAGARLSP
jgi:hypothetical protein